MMHTSIEKYGNRLAKFAIARCSYEDPIGIPVTARLPELNLIIDVTNHPKEKRVKELICGVNGIKYVNLPENLPETEIISMIRKAFAESRIYLNSDPVEDLERIKASYTRWRKA